MIHYSVQARNIREMFGMRVVYGFKEPELRRGLWEDIKDIHGNITGLWELLGDFNCILCREERIGRLVTVAEIKKFQIM